MDDKKLDLLLARLIDERVQHDPASFQRSVWAKLSGTRSAQHGQSLGRALALRAAPAALVLAVGSFVGATLIETAPEPDLLAVFDTDAEWSFAKLVDGKGTQ